MNQTRVQRLYVRRAKFMNDKAARLGRPGRVTAETLAAIFISYEGSCAYCGIDIEPEHSSFDHVIPFDRGGTNTSDNIVPCCMTCNRTKYTKVPEELAAWQALQVVCPVDGTVFRPRWADHQRGYGQYCSRRCAGSIGGRA